GFLAEDFIQTPHSLVCFHDSLAHIHDPVDHLAAGGSKQGVEDKVDKHCAYISAGRQQQCCWDQQSKGSVDKRKETCLPHTAAHGILAGQIAVVSDSGVKGFEGIDRLLEHLYNRDASDIFYRFAAHTLNF